MPPYPISIKKLHGQEKAKKILLKSLESGRMSHAFLFRGPEGVGKKTFAYAFAALLNCESVRDEEPCGACPSCAKFLSGNHPDLLRIEPDGAAIKIKQIRDLKHTLGFPPFEAGSRVVILPDIHTMRREAANSLLKTLEEPPERTFLILTAEESVSLLPTIASRCQIIPFMPLPPEAVAAILEKDHDPETAASLAAVSGGSAGRAQTIFDRNLLETRQKVIETLTRFKPEQPESIGEILSLAGAAADHKENLPDLLDLLSFWIRDLILVTSGMNQSLVVNSDITDLLGAAAGRWSPDQLSDKLKFIDRARKQLLHNCNRALVCEVLFFQLL